MNFGDLPALEQKAVLALLQADGVPSELRVQVDQVVHVTRSVSTGGVYVDFHLGDEAVPLPGLHSFHIADLHATSSTSDEVGFILFVREGLMACLEVYTTADVMPPHDSVASQLLGVPKIYA